MAEITISPDPIDAPETLKEFETEASGAGGIVSFTGNVRPVSKLGRVKSLFLQSYSPLTEKGIQSALETAQARWPLMSVRIVHRVGEMAPSETIVFVATASAHRRAAFEAADFLMDYLKTEAVFWKKETTETDETWIEPRDEDFSDADRWQLEDAT